MRKLSFVIILVFASVVLVLAGWYFFAGRETISGIIDPTVLFEEASSPTPMPTPGPVLTQPSSFALLPQGLQAFQTFNNCGPATLAMLLSYYQINVSQQELGTKLRPYQNPQGDNDDKSVTFEEMAGEAENYNLIPYMRPGGTIETLKMFTANGVPVAVRTTLNPDDDIGHFRVVVGFDDATGEIIQDDSYHGPRLRYSYQSFLAMWQPFNYQYMILVRPEDVAEVEAILSEDKDERRAWQRAYDKALQETAQDPDDIYPQFNLVTSLYYLERYEDAIEIFEQIEGRLPFRTLWYQIEPIQAYQKLANYTRIFSLTDNILNNSNRAFSQLYIIRGDAFLQQGDEEGARQEYEKAVFYNQNLVLAEDKLTSVDLD